jgi:predicted DNA-binding protein (MmcQ/YjbR family)
MRFIRARRDVKMNRDEVIEHCLSLPGAIEDYPFGDDVAVFKVGGRMFALVLLNESPGRVNLKCDPTWALELRARLPAVTPGYHADKRHWNTVALDGTVDSEELDDMIQHSYRLVVAKLSRSDRAKLAES